MLEFDRGKQLKMKKISGSMLITEILDMDTRFTEILKKHGLNCFGCPASKIETLSEAAKGHDANIDKILEELNQCCKSDME